MAKKIIQPDEAKDETVVTESKAAVQDSPLTLSITDLQPKIAGLLKAFSNYKTLYIDSYGGVFTEDTPKNIRGKAILYHNPFHKQ